MEKEFEEIIAEINESIVYQMSLGNKELFHSNLWKWIMIQKNEAIKVFFPNVDISNLKEVNREDGNRDIVIRLTNYEEYVIENKLKSYHDEEQLERYGNKKNYPNFSGGIITGIKEPYFILPKGWKFLSYGNIAEGLIKIAYLFDEYQQKVILDYCKMLKNINVLLYEQLKKNNNKLCYKSQDFDPLKRINLLDVYMKLKGADFISFSSQKLENLFKDRAKKIGCVFEIEKPSFHNSKTTLTFKIEYLKEIGLGIQMEDDQYRLFCWKNGLKEMELYNYFTNILWLDSSFPSKARKNEERFIFDNKTRLTKCYCGYSGNYWIYQYYSIQETFDNSYDKILNQLIIDFEKAFGLLEVFIKNIDLK